MQIISITNFVFTPSLTSTLDPSQLARMVRTGFLNLLKEKCEGEFWNHEAKNIRKN